MGKPLVFSDTGTRDPGPPPTLGQHTDAVLGELGYDPAGRRGTLQAWYDVLAIWRDWADDVRGRGVDCGHYVAEEAPDETYAELRAFLAT